MSEFKPFLPKVVPYTHRPAFWHALESDSHELPHEVTQALTEAVLHQLDGRWRSTGYIGALCPFPHQRDRPGMHFSYHPESGWGHCFGKHGKISPAELCKALGVTVHYHVA